MTVPLQLIFFEAKIKTRRFLFTWKFMGYRHEYEKLKKIDA